MKAILEFNLPEDDYDFALALYGDRYRRALADLRDSLRAKVKYTDDVGSWQEAYELFWDTLKEAGVELD